VACAKEMKSNIVHQYLKKENKEGKILLQIDPIRNRVQEIVFLADGSRQVQEGPLGTDADALIREGFENSTALEFHLHLSGLL